MAIVFWIHARNRWPESIQRRLAELNHQGVPTTLAECDQRYRALGSESEATHHFQKAFKAISKQKLPLLPPPQLTNHKWSPRLPRLSEMGSPDQLPRVVSCLQSNAEALQLLREGMSYSRCLFPIRLIDGYQELLPHLPKCEDAAHLLALDSVYNIRNGDEAKAANSALACFHLAEILRDEPNLVAIAVRNRILGIGCIDIQSCLNLAPFSISNLITLSARLRSAMEVNEKELHRGLATERCLGLSIFQGSNAEIARFMDEGAEPRLGVIWGVEVLRAEGILQRDAAYFIDFTDQIDSASTNASRREMVGELEDIESDVEENRALATKDTKRCNLVSGLLLPFAIRSVQIHLWTRTLGEITLASIAIERYRQEHGQLPTDLRSLVPAYLEKVPEDPYTGGTISYRPLPKGYVLFAGRLDAPGSSDGAPASKKDLDSSEIVFRVER